MTDDAGPDWQPEEDELRAEIARHAATGREVERELAVWRLADRIMWCTLPVSTR